MDRLYYTPRQVADALAISDDAVLDLVNRGELPALRVSPRLIRIPIAAFDLWRAGYVPRRRRVVIRAASERVAIGDDTAIGADEHLPERTPALRR